MLYVTIMGKSKIYRKVGDVSGKKNPQKNPSPSQLAYYTNFSKQGFILEQIWGIEMSVHSAMYMIISEKAKFLQDWS